MRIEHTQLIGQKHMVTSTRIGVCGMKNLPKLQVYFCKRQERRLMGHYSGSSHRYILFLQCTIIYVYICIATKHLFFILYTVCNATCIIMHRLDIDTLRRIVLVFLKSAGYLVSQIKNRHQQAIIIPSILSYRLPNN